MSQLSKQHNLSEVSPQVCPSARKAYAHCRRGKHDCTTDEILHACIHSAQIHLWVVQHDDPQKHLCRWAEVSTRWQLPTVLDVALMGGLVTLFSGYIL